MECVTNGNVNGLEIGKRASVQMMTLVGKRHKTYDGAG